MKTKKMFIGLGAAAAFSAAIVPMTGYAVTDIDSKSVDVALKVGATISMSLNNNKIEPSILTSEDSVDKSTIATVTTNSASGYTLSATTSTTGGALIGDTSSNNTISYVGSNYSSATTAGWALSVGGSYKDISGNKISLVPNGTPLANNEQTTINYNFKTIGTTVPDTYKTTLTYTASVK